MSKKKFKCICKNFEVSGRSKIFKSLEECPICGEKISHIDVSQMGIKQIETEQPEENQIPVLTAREHLLENSPTYFATSERNQRVISAIMKGR